MTSKYDLFWLMRLDEIRTLITRAASGEPALLDVSDIRPLGNRDSWYGKAQVRGGQVLYGQMAHASALANLVAEEGLCDPYPDMTFTLTIDRRMRLRVMTGVSPAMPEPAGQERVSQDNVRETEALSPTIACGRIHAAIEHLPIYRAPADVPFSDGLYFFYEQSEESPHGYPHRIVRIGNHPHAAGRLVGRLKEHYAARPGGKNSSVFRRYLGGALMRREDPTSLCLGPGPGRGHWEQHKAPACSECNPYELTVTQQLNEHFWFRCLAIDDQNERNDFEQALIATVASCDACRPSADWLGNYAYNPLIREIGLWNTQHVHGVRMGVTRLERFEELANLTQARTTPADLAHTLLLIPCSAGKRGTESLALPDRSVADFVSDETAQVLKEGRAKAFARTRLDDGSPLRSALAYYSGQPYAQPSFRAHLVEAISQGLHCLIVSGGYGLLRPEERIHSYEAHLPTQTRSIWAPRIPFILRDYVRQNAISRTFGAFSTGYATVVPDRLSGNDWRFVPRFVRGEDRGSAIRVVPERVGLSLSSLLKSGLQPSQGWTRVAPTVGGDNLPQ
jgi:hypothetical protein